jgi:hypothetical protein
MTILVESKGGRAFTLRLDQFPKDLHDELRARMQGVTEQLEAKARGLAPYKTGTLRSEITGRTFSDVETRVASYTNVFAPNPPPGKNEYAKAATLEYGSDKARKINAKSVSNIGRITEKAKSRAAHIEAFLYLRGALDEIQAQAIPEIQAAVDAAVAKGNA